MRAVELFCGCGLSALGLVRAGCELVGACDLDQQAVDMFNGQPGLLPPVARALDVDRYDIPPCDLLSGGPVCKAFSPGATLFGTQGADDARNTFPHFLRAVERAQPPYVLIENSFGFARFKGYVQEVTDSLRRFGYQLDMQEVDCYDYGVPQHRRRVVILGSKSGDWRITRPTLRPGPAAVGECLSPAPAADRWPLLTPCTPTQLDYLLRDPRHLKKHPPLDPTQPASTVVAVYRKGVPYGTVRLNDRLYMCGPRLAARLQGIPDEYRFATASKTKVFEAVGNGFPPQVGEWLVRSLTECVS